MAKPFKELRKQMYGEGVGQADVAEHLGKSPCYVSIRLRGLMPWDLEDVYKLCDLLHIPEEQIAFYFPRGDMKRGA